MKFSSLKKILHFSFTFTLTQPDLEEPSLPFLDDPRIFVFIFIFIGRSELPSYGSIRSRYPCRAYKAHFRASKLPFSAAGTPIVKITFPHPSLYCYLKLPLAEQTCIAGTMKAQQVVAVLFAALVASAGADVFLL